MSFEDGTGDDPAAWSFYSWKESSGWWDAEHAYRGRKSLGLKGLNGGWSARVPVEGGKVHRICLHYRIADGPSRIVLYVRVPTGPREMKTLLYKPVRAIPPDQQGRFVDGAYVGGADDRGWVELDGGDFVADERVDSVSILIKLVSDNPKAKAWVDDVLVEAVERPATPNTAELLHVVPGAKIWADDENRKILPSAPPPQGPAVQGIEVSAARGEFESFQIAVTPAKKGTGPICAKHPPGRSGKLDLSPFSRAWHAVQWKWTAFSGPAPLPHTALRCRRIETIRIERPQGPHSHKGLNPDPLTDRLPCDIPSGTSQGFWFTLRVPRQQAAGQYRGTLHLSVDDHTVANVPLILRVRDFDIPSRPSIDVRSGLRREIVLPRENGESEAVLKRYYRNIFEHRSRCNAGVSIRVRLEGNTATVDATDYLRHLRFMRDELGAKRFNVPALWIGHRGTHRMRADAKWHGRRVFDNDELTRLHPDFEAPFRSYLTQLIQSLKQERLFLDPIVKFFDEPNLEDRNTLNALRTLSQLLLDIEPELTVNMTATYPHPELIDVCRLWVLHTDAWDANLHHIEAARKAGCRISVYNNAVNFPEHRPIRVRLWPWLLRKYRVDGTNSWWGTVCWRNAMEDPWTAGQGSSGVLLYPPRSNQEHGPIGSVRWELFREGLEDYEYLCLADRLADELAKAGNTELAGKGRAAIAQALALVDRWPNVKAANDEPYTLDVTAVESARERLASVIEAMTAALRQP